jgi:putative Mn2+ efflux pump MntP
MSRRHFIYSFGYLSPRFVANWEFVVGMVLTVVLGVRMLWSVGEEEMGGVLGSGVSPVKKH